MQPKRAIRFFILYCVLGWTRTSPGDIEALCDRGILNHTLATHEQVFAEAAELNTLSLGVAYEEQHNFPLHKVIRDIDIHTSYPRNKWRVLLMRTYFPSPTNLISFTFTVVGMYLAVVQTVFGVLSYNPPKQ
ncbi:unnamed protein product [Ilex paraguariensis]|uniref:Uncharacterized protein n=1 Tax=Ilex paraguariensis TaxID=185542 RepID=A0ABC8SWC5_9AQUA